MRQPGRLRRPQSQPSLPRDHPGRTAAAGTPSEDKRAGRSSLPAPGLTGSKCLGNLAGSDISPEPCVQLSSLVTEVGDEPLAIALRQIQWSYPHNPIAPGQTPGLAWRPNHKLIPGAKLAGKPQRQRPGRSHHTESCELHAHLQSLPNAPILAGQQLLRKLNQIRFPLLPGLLLEMPRR